MATSTASSRRRRRTALLILGLGLALPATGLGAAPRCVGADTPAAQASIALMRRAVVCLVNQQRVGRHLPPLRDSRRLDQSAQSWSNAMVRAVSFTHGSDFSARISATGYAWGEAGENIATGFATPWEVVRGWMRSTEHCKNILDPAYADVGTGVDPRRLGIYGSATWTQDFALWMGHPAPSANLGPARGCPYRI